MTSYVFVIKPTKKLNFDFKFTEIYIIFEMILGCGPQSVIRIFLIGECFWGKWGLPRYFDSFTMPLNLLQDSGL
jgi:hypothetical protein